MYDGTTDPVEFYKDFARAYRTGKTGTQSGIPPSVMAPAEVRGAMSAGRRDAAVMSAPGLGVSQIRHKSPGVPTPLDLHPATSGLHPALTAAGSGSIVNEKGSFLHPGENAPSFLQNRAGAASAPRVGPAGIAGLAGLAGTPGTAGTAGTIGPSGIPGTPGDISAAPTGEGHSTNEGAGNTSDRICDFKKFQDKTEAQKWGVDEYSTWKSGLSAEETSALTAYTGDGCYQNINAVLRGAESQYTGNNQQIVQQLSQALSKASVPKNITLFRGASKIMFGKYSNLSPEQLIGKVISDKAFMSTSLVGEGAFDADLTLVIETPEGAQGAYIGNLSYYPEEAEVLLNKGQQMVIKNVLDAGTSNMKIVVELIP